MRLHSEELIFLFFFLYRWTMKGEEWLPKRMGIENQSQLAVMAVYLHQVYVFFIFLCVSFCFCFCWKSSILLVMIKLFYYLTIYTLYYISASNVEVRLPMGDQEAGIFSSNLVVSSNDIRFKHQRRAVRIDEVCRFVFPLGFIIFNVCYWNYYKSEDPIY